MHLDSKIYILIYIPLNQLQDSSGSLCFIYNPLKLKLLFNKKILYRMVPYISGETLYLWTSATWPKLRQFAIPTLFYPFHPYLPYMRICHISYNFLLTSPELYAKVLMLITQTNFIKDYWNTSSTECVFLRPEMFALHAFCLNSQ